LTVCFGIAIARRILIGKGEQKAGERNRRNDVLIIRRDRPHSPWMNQTISDLLIRRIGGAFTAQGVVVYGWQKRSRGLKFVF